VSGGRFAEPLADGDPETAGLLERELDRQRRHIELIASENIVSRAVLDALGHAITNKTVEGYPGKRFHGGAEVVDRVERLAVERAKALFGAAYANVQPHSGSQANLAVFFALLKPGERVLAMDLAAGGHLSHGAKANLSGRWFEAHGYGVRRSDGLIDYEGMEARAREVQPRLIVAGGSAYPRAIDFARFRRAADQVGARLLVDMAHIAGLVAAGAHESPLPHADVVTCTTTKTLRGPRGGVILTNDEALSKALDSAVFPGVQGSIHLQVIAAKAVCFKEARADAFKAYARQVIANARALAAALAARGYRIWGGGSDTHLVLVDVAGKGLTGARAEARLERAGLTCNKNATPLDPTNPARWTGIRLGTAAATTRGFAEAEFDHVGHLIADLLDDEAAGGAAGGAAADRVDARAAAAVADLSERFPIY
jgi:glycine hydroxymethyltransferase